MAPKPYRHGRGNVSTSVVTEVESRDNGVAVPSHTPSRDTRIARGGSTSGPLKKRLRGGHTTANVKAAAKKLDPVMSSSTAKAEPAASSNVDSSSGDGAARGAGSGLQVSTARASRKGVHQKGQKLPVVKAAPSSDEETESEDEGPAAPKEETSKVAARPRRSSRTPIVPETYSSATFDNANPRSRRRSPRASATQAKSASAETKPRKAKAPKRKAASAADEPPPKKYVRPGKVRQFARLVPKEHESKLIKKVKKEYAKWLKCDEPLEVDREQGILEPTAKLNRTFETRFLELLVFSKVYGHMHVPKEYLENPALGRWVRQVRSWRTKSDNHLTASRKKRLDAVGFVWEPRTQADFWKIQGNHQKATDMWEASFRELLEYKEKHGDCIVPKEFKANLGLARWVGKQRKHYKNKQEGKYHALDDEKEKRLVEVGFVFNTKTKEIMRQTVMKRYEDRWEEFCERLLAFKEEYGHCAVPRRWKQDEQLSSWVMRQRLQYRRFKKGEHSYLTEERIEHLSEMGFVFGEMSRKIYPLISSKMRKKVPAGRPTRRRTSSDDDEDSLDEDASDRALTSTRRRVKEAEEAPSDNSAPGAAGEVGMTTETETDASTPSPRRKKRKTHQTQMVSSRPRRGQGAATAAAEVPAEPRASGRVARRKAPEESEDAEKTCSSKGERKDADKKPAAKPRGKKVRVREPATAKQPNDHADTTNGDRSTKEAKGKPQKNETRASKAKASVAVESSQAETKETRTSEAKASETTGLIPEEKKEAATRKDAVNEQSGDTSMGNAAESETAKSAEKVIEKKASKDQPKKQGIRKGVWTCRNCNKDEFGSFVEASAHEAMCSRLGILALAASARME